MKKLLLFILFLNLISICFGQVKIDSTGAIAPVGTNAVTESQYVKGAPQVVYDIAGRNAIPDYLRAEGMAVFVISDSTTYRLLGGLTDEFWVLQTGSSIGIDGSGMVVIDTTVFTQGTNDVEIYTYGFKIVAVSVLSVNGTGWTRYLTNGEYTYIHYPTSPYGLVRYQLTTAAGSTNIGTGTPVTLPALDTPHVSANYIGPNQIDVQWEAVPNAQGTLLEVSDDGINWRFLYYAPPTATTFNHFGLTANTKYHYRTIAVADPKFYTNSVASITNATTSDLIPLAASVLSATPLDTSRIRLDWTSVANAVNYVIDWSTNNSTWTNLITTANNVFTYTHTGLLPVSAIYYRLRVEGDNITYASSLYDTSFAVTDPRPLPPEPEPEPGEPEITEAKFGVLSAPLSTNNTQTDVTGNVATLMGLDLVRIGTTYPGTHGNIRTLATEGFEIAPNINPTPQDGTRNFTSDAERAGRITWMADLINNTLLSRRDTLLVCNNEPANTGYRIIDTVRGSPTNSARLYAMNELKPMDSLAKIHGDRFKTACGGFTGQSMWWFAWKNKMDSGRISEANELAYHCFTSGQRANLRNWETTAGGYQVAIAMTKQLLEYYRDIDFDYLNIHIKAPINGVDSSNINRNIIKYAVEAWQNLSCKKVITNELGSKSITPNIITELAAESRKYMDYVIFYDGRGISTQPTSSGSDVTFRNSDTQLNSIGIALKTLIASF